MRDIVVKKYKGESALQRGLNDMAKNGYVVDQQASRKAMYSLATGVFTRKQIHTVTFRKNATVAAAASPPDAAADGDVIGQLERIGKLRDSGVLTAQEFDAQKALILKNSAVPPPDSSSTR